MRVYLYVLISALLRLDPFAPIERSLEQQLMDKITGLEAASITITASRLGFLLFGFCRRIVVEMRGLPVNALRVDSFKIEAESFRFRPFYTFVLNRPLVVACGDVLWNLRVLDSDIEHYIDSRGPFMKGVEVKIEPEVVTLRRSSSIAVALNLKEPLSLSGRLTLNQNRNVCLELDHLHTFGIGPGKRLLNTALNLINPILTRSDINRILSRTQDGPLESVKLSAEFENIYMDNGHIDIHGWIIAEKSAKQDKLRRAEPSVQEKKTSKSNKSMIIGNLRDRIRESRDKRKVRSDKSKSKS